MEEKKNKVINKRDDVYFRKVICVYLHSTRVGFLIFQETNQEFVAFGNNKFGQNHFIETPLKSKIELSKQKLF